MRSTLVAICSALLLTALVAAPPAQAQEPDRAPRTTGFSNPDDVGDIDAYRLPDWSFSTFILNGNSDVGFQSQTQEVERNRLSTTADQDQTNIDLSLSPQYNAFWESETRIASFFFVPRVQLRDQSTSDEQEFSGGGSEPTQEVDDTRFTLALSTGGDVSRYVVPDRLFLFGAADGSYRYTRDARTQSIAGANQDQERTVTANEYEAVLQTRAGLGFGRVRDVTPVIRALRVNERLQAVGASPLSADGVQSAARQFAREFAYDDVFDRPDKFFWQDFFDRAGASSDELTAFETFYLVDVLQERVGRRLDGADLVIGPQLDAQTEDLNLSFDPVRPSAPPQEIDQSQTRLSVFLQGRVFENLSLRHQVSAEVNAEVQALAGGRATDPNGAQIVQTRFGWLWSVADAYLVNTSLNTVFERNVGSASEDISTRRQRYVLASNLFYFIEDRVSVNAGVQVLHRRQTSDSDRVETQNRIWDLGLNVGVRYILTRSLR